MPCASILVLSLRLLSSRMPLYYYLKNKVKKETNKCADDVPMAAAEATQTSRRQGGLQASRLALGLRGM